MTTEDTSINSAAEGDNGGTDGDNSAAYTQQASDFIANTSLDKMLEIAEEALRKKILARATEPRKWVIPDELGE